MRYTKLNNLVGWVVFFIALVTYTLTAAPTASFWDCGEFIATANELEVPHPPGAPLFLLAGRVFAMFAPSPDKIALFVNMVSVLSSAFLALFTFWITTALAKRVLAPGKDLSDDIDGFTSATILFAGAVAGLTCTFLDTVWFNAVEAEVYAGSSMFTAMVVWLMFKWEARADEPHNLRWIVLIAFMMGLSVGVHLLNLLTIPALALVYYFRKYSFSWLGFGVTLGASIVILAVVQFGIIQYTWDLAWSVEKSLVGTINLDTNKKTGMGLPFGSGALVFGLILVGLLAVGIYVSNRRNLVALNTVLVSTLMVYIGFSSYATILIRSNVDPAIDQNNPGSLVNFLSYLKREQYGDKPLLYGQMYNSRINQNDPYVKKDANYVRLRQYDRYVFDNYKLGYNYEKSTLRFFPRMYDPDHYASGPHGYKNYVKNKGENPDDPMDDRPTGIDNLKFFFGYQVYHMYFRYLLWNFVGRESDVQHASWESGWEFGKLKAMPTSMRNDRTRNHYYGIPLLLGLIGLFWHLQADRKRWGVVMALFLFTGLAIVVYLNQVAQEPRERDYAFVGSYHTFAIWVGLGVVSLVTLTERFLKKSAPYAMGTLCLVAVPGLMLSQNWNDHSRAGDFVPPDSAYNLLNSCAPNAIIFTNGDNDTFPLWYIQEVEGVRTDVRVVNLSLLNTDWYIYQLKHNQSNKSAPLPITFDEDFYMGERNASKQVARFTLELPVDKKKVVENGLVSAAEEGKVESPMRVNVAVRGRGEYTYLMKQDMMILNILQNVAADGWQRPVYFANTVGPSSYIGLQDYFELQGMAYRIIPVKDADNGPQGLGRINLDTMYNNVVHKFRYRGLNDPSIFFDENTVRMISNFRSSFFRLASGYLDAADKLERELPDRKGKQEKVVDAAKQEQIDKYRLRAKEVMEFGDRTITDEAVPMQMSTLYLDAMAYDRLGDKQKSDALLKKAQERAGEYLAYAQNNSSITSEDENDYLYVLERVLQYRLANSEYKEAANIASQIYQFTGEERFLQIAKEYGNRGGVVKDTTMK
jgi:hypothetical protein